MLVLAAARRPSSGHGAPGARVRLLFSWACGRRWPALHGSPPSFPQSPCRRECPAALVPSRPFVRAAPPVHPSCVLACEDGCRDVSLLAPAHALPPQDRGRQARGASPQAEPAPGVSAECAAPKHVYLLLQVRALCVVRWPPAIQRIHPTAHPQAGPAQTKEFARVIAITGTVSRCQPLRPHRGVERPRRGGRVCWGCAARCRYRCNRRRCGCYRHGCRRSARRVAAAVYMYICVCVYMNI